ncbi:MAG: hypothetical protein ACREPM_08180 [Gemmatimonadaceae bacterium]
MTDPREAKQPGDQEFNANADEVKDLDAIDVRPEDAERVKGGEAEDPCAGGRLKKKLL